MEYVSLLETKSHSAICSRDCGHKNGDGIPEGVRAKGLFHRTNLANCVHSRTPVLEQGQPRIGIGTRLETKGLALGVRPESHVENVTAK